MIAKIVSLLFVFFYNNAFAISPSEILDKPISESVIGIILLTTTISLAPALLIITTSFTRILVVLSFLRNAIGLQQTPPNIVIIVLSLFLTIFVMLPTLETSYNNAISEVITGEKNINEETISKIVEPFNNFMLNNTPKSEIQALLDIAKIKDTTNPPFRVLAPSFMISELKKAFEIGFLIFLPFIIIDLLVASILMSMGMMMLPPVVISLPFKIIFFVLIDGWSIISISLIKGFVF